MLKKYYRINQAAGVSINIRQDGTVKISACRITANGNRLDIDKKIIDLNSIDELKNFVPAKFPIALNISGRGVLYKQINKIEKIDQDSFSKIMPNANLDDFYVQNFISGNLSFVAIIRRSEADKWVAFLINQQFSLLMLSLGPFPAQHILSQLNLYDDEIMFDGHKIQRDEQQDWAGYNYEETALTPFTLKIESEKIDEELIIPYAAAFQLVLALQLELIQAFVPSLDKIFNNTLENRKIKVFAFLALSAIFVLLLFNFILFTWLGSSSEKLTDQVSRFAQNTTSIQNINEQVRKKETVLHDLGWDGGVNKSTLIDQLAALMPAEITLKQFDVNPIDVNGSRSQRVLVFFNRRIRIVGTSDKIIPVNEWMARMKTKQWVKNMQMENYAFNSELNTGQFTIILDY